jgi:hypothetical protein
VVSGAGEVHYVIETDGKLWLAIEYCTPTWLIVFADNQ